MSDSKNSTFAALLFDMDGTLVNSEPLWLAAEEELMARYGYPWSVADQAHCLGGPLERLGEYMHSLVGGENGGTYFKNEIIALMAQKMKEGVELMEGARELLELAQELKIPMVLVSASPRLLVDAVLDNFLDHPFLFSISSDDVRETKPNPEGYLLAAKSLALPIQECLILEDSATGVAAGKASGGYVIAIPHLVAIAPSAKLKVIHSLKELDRNLFQNLYRDWNVDEEGI